MYGGEGGLTPTTLLRQQSPEPAGSPRMTHVHALHLTSPAQAASQPWAAKAAGWCVTLEDGNQAQHRIASITQNPRQTSTRTTHTTPKNKTKKPGLDLSQLERQMPGWHGAARCGKVGPKTMSKLPYLKAQIGDNIRLQASFSKRRVTGHNVEQTSRRVRGGVGPGYAREPVQKRRRRRLPYR